MKKSYSFEIEKINQKEKYIITSLSKFLSLENNIRGKKIIEKRIYGIS